MRAWLRVAILGAIVLGAVLLPAAAHACPMCNQSIADQDKLPQAYMYSILFMLGMPATVFVGIGGVIVYTIRKHAKEQAARQVVESQTTSHELVGQV